MPRTCANAATLLLVAAALVASVIGHGDEHSSHDMSGMDMGGTTLAGVDPCISDSTQAECETYVYADADVLDDMADLCAAMSFMPGCTLWAHCEERNSTAGACSPFSLLANVCERDMPGMRGCANYVALCGDNSTVVAQCTEAPALAGVLLTADATDAVLEACSTTTLSGPPTGCQVCNSSMDCPDPLAALSLVCTGTPDIEQCSGFMEMCASDEAVEAFPLLCLGPETEEEREAIMEAIVMRAAAAADKDGGMDHGSMDHGSMDHGSMDHGSMDHGDGSMEDGSMDDEGQDTAGGDKCVTDPTAADCKTYTYAKAGDDLVAICRASPQLVACTLHTSCEESGETEGPCAPFSLLSAACSDQPKLKGCTNFSAMCAKGSMVEQCTEEAAPMRVPTTQAATDAVLAMCGTHAMEGCQRCADEISCEDPLGVLAQVCWGMPGMSDCRPLFDFCQAVEGADVAYGAICDDPSGTETVSESSSG